MSQPICKAPFMAVRVSADGYLNPCCWMANITGLKTSTKTIKEYWDSEELKLIRQQMFEDKLPSSCKRCTLSNDDIDYNRIEFFDDVINDHPIENQKWVIDQPMMIRQMDANLSNKCNLKCRHCGPDRSTAWIKDYAKLDKRLQGDFNLKANIGNTSFIHDKDVFRHIRKINFKGGEPMMQDEMYTLLENLINWGYASDIGLFYITNGSKPSKHLHNLWKHFNKVDVSMSFEATGDLFEYVRGGSVITWEQFNQTFEEYTSLDFIKGIDIAHTLMNFTLFDLPNQLKWIEDMHTKYKLRGSKKTVDNFKFDNIVTIPEYLNIKILPRELKLKLIKDYTQLGYKSLEVITNTLQQSLDTPNTRYWNDFVLYTNTLDKIRNQSLSSVVPEFKEYIE